VVTHDLKSAFRVADRMVVLNNGRIVTAGKPNDIRSCRDPFVHKFIQGPVEAKTAVFPRSAMEKPLPAQVELEPQMTHDQ
jgi:ABC-type transporter Mla maintaining outer membrane lipid asymmetry ATPase subunit MlaF